MQAPNDYRTIACAGTKYGDVADDATGILRVKCRDRRCRRPGVDEVVIHYFDLATGDLLETRRFARVREPQPQT